MGHDIGNHNETNLRIKFLKEMNHKETNLRSKGSTLKLRRRKRERAWVHDRRVAKATLELLHIDFFLHGISHFLLT